MITGRCLCGAVRYRISGAPLALYHCHCSQCRHANGASFATNLLVRSEHLEVGEGDGALAAFESSPGKLRHFCSRCGSPIFSADAKTPQLRSIRSGTLDADPGLRPSAHFHVASRAPWVEIHDDLPRSPRGPGEP